MDVSYSMTMVVTVAHFSFFPAFSLKDFLIRLFFNQNNGAGDFQTRKVEVVSGANMFLHRELFERTGGFDEKKLFTR